MKGIRDEGARFAVERAIAYRLRRLQGRVWRALGWSQHFPDIAQYRLMKADNAAAESVYQADDFLVPINSRIVDYLYSGASRDLRDSQINGWFGAMPPNSRRIYRSLLWLYYNHVKRLDTDGLLDTLHEPLEGGIQSQEVIDGKPVSLDFLQSIEEFYGIRKSWALAGRSDKPRLIVELGGGYGRLAYVFRKALPDSTYVLLDLPEALVCAYSWLKAVLPQEEIVEYSKGRALSAYSREVLLSAPLWILGAHAIERLETADVFVSINNFVVMSPEAVANYLKHMVRIASVLYFRQDRNTVTVPRGRMLYSRTTALHEAIVELAFQTE
jgi:putative sugar O-methyltransferase